MEVYVVFGTFKLSLTQQLQTMESVYMLRADQPMPSRNVTDLHLDLFRIGCDKTRFPLLDIP